MVQPHQLPAAPASLIAPEDRQVLEGDLANYNFAWASVGNAARYWHRAGGRHRGRPQGLRRAQSDQERILVDELHRFVRFKWDVVTALAATK